MTEAKRGKVTPEMEAVAKAEWQLVEFLLWGIVAGRLIIPRNARRESVSI